MLATALFLMAGKWTQSNVYILVMGLLYCDTSPQWVSLINIQELLIHETMWVSLEGKNIKWWKPETKVPTPSGFIYMTFYKREKFGTECRSMIAKGWKWGRRLTSKDPGEHDEVTEMFNHLTVLMVTRPYTFVKIHQLDNLNMWILL